MAKAPAAPRSQNASTPAEGKVVVTEAPYGNRYVFVLTLRGGEVVRWRDYLDPLAVFDALGWPSR